MIIVMSEKQFKKNVKKLAEPKDYVVCDSTNDENGSLTKYSNVVSMEGFNPPAKLVKCMKDKDFDTIDEEKLKKIERKFFKGKPFITCTMAVVSSMVKNDDDRQLNMFIVLRNKAYKVYSKKLVKKMRKIFDTDFEFIYTFEEYEDDKKLLKRDLKNNQVNNLLKQIKKLEKKNDCN